MQNKVLWAQKNENFCVPELNVLAGAWVGALLWQTYNSVVLLK